MKKPPASPSKPGARVLIGGETLTRLRRNAKRFRRELADMRIAVVCGGDTSERDVSLISGRSVWQALKDEGFHAKIVDLNYSKLTSKTFAGYDVAFLTLHGGRGENGALQGFLDCHSLPYVGAGVLASSVSMNKAIFKALVVSLGLDTAPYVHLVGRELSTLSLEQFSHLSVNTYVVKPAREGSSVGVSIVHQKDLLSTVKRTLKTFGEVIVEEYISGAEVTVSILGERTKPVILPLVEIRPKKEPFYDYKAKYTRGETDYIIPPSIPAEIQKALAEDSALIFRVIDFSPYVRIDTRVREDGTYCFLEANTLPGFTSLSLFPQSAQCAGISYPELLIILLYLALRTPKK